MNITDLNGVIDANAIADANIPTDFNIATILGFELPAEITGITTIVANFIGNILSNVGVAEAGVIIILIPLAFLMLRFNFYLQLILKIGAVLAIVIVALILFGLVNF